MSRKPKDRTLFQSLILGNPGPVAALLAAAHRIDELAAVRGNVLRGNVKSPGRAARGQLPARAAATLDESSKRSHHQPILIIVEDDPDDFMLLKRALWKAGATARVWWARDVS